MSRRFEIQSMILWSALALAFPGCLKEESGPGTLTGTSTSVGTSIGGTAMLSDGSPAAGARIRVRADTVVFDDGIPHSPVLDSALADGQGRFKLRTPKPSIFHLEIEAEPEVYAAIVFGLPSHGDFAALRLARPGSLKGSIQDSTAAEGKVWIGIPGTGWIAEAVRPAAGSDPRRRDFRLDGIYPGEYRLQVIRPPSDTGLNLQLKLAPLQVISGSVTDAGVISY